MNKKDLLTESIVNVLHSKGKMTESVDWDYYNKFEEITDKYMSNQGEGDTLASQIVTAINKLVYKWYNDGDVFDNVHSGLSGWANDLSSYANWLYKYCEEAKPILYNIYGMGDESDYETLLQELADACLNEEFLKEFEKPKQGSIYNCDGPFEFSEYSEDEEEEDYYDDDEYLDSMDESKKLNEKYEEEFTDSEGNEYIADYDNTIECKVKYIEASDPISDEGEYYEKEREEYVEIPRAIIEHKDKYNMEKMVRFKLGTMYEKYPNESYYKDVLNIISITPTQSVDTKLKEAQIYDDKDEIYESRVHRTLSVGDTFQNENGVSVVILDVDDKNQVTYRFSDGKTECHPMESVNNMLNENGYTKLNESKELKKEGFTAREHLEATLQKYIQEDGESYDIQTLVETHDFILTGRRDKENPTDIYLQVWSSSYDYVTVYINQDYKGKVKLAEINWSAIGSVDVDKTEEFINHLQSAIEFVKQINGKDFSNEIK